MSNPQLYSRVDVIVDSVLLLEQATVELTRKSNSQMQSSTQKDYAGESPGAKTLEIKIVSGVPTADFELDVGKYMQAGTFSTVTLRCAGRTLTTTGTWLEDGLTGGVDGPTKLSQSFRGQFAPWR